MKERVVILLSGGLDSTTLLYDLKQNESLDIFPMFFEWGQPAYGRERAAVRAICEDLNLFLVEKSIDMSHSMSCILGGEGEEEVEARNLVFLATAISYALTLEATTIYYGALRNPVDHEYVDASEEFVTKLNEVAKLFDPQLRVVAPYINMNKLDVADIAFKVHVPIALVDSCNHPVEWEPCGNCGDCASFVEVLQSSFDPAYLRYVGRETDAEYVERRLAQQPVIGPAANTLWVSGALHTSVVETRPEELLGAIAAQHVMGVSIVYVAPSPHIFAAPSLRISAATYSALIPRLLQYLLTTEQEGIGVVMEVNETVLTPDLLPLLQLGRNVVITPGLTLRYTAR